MPEVAVFTLLHLLVFAYWLGGDLGAFYTSRFLIRPGISADRRLMAAKIVGDVDMAPRSALILTLPTGLTLAVAKGWILIGPIAMAAVWAGSLAWLALAWLIHFQHTDARTIWRQVDTAIRWLMIVGLTAAAVWNLASADGLPLFLSLKLLSLAACIGLGLFIRAVLKPLGPALMGLSGPDAAAAEARVASMLTSARPLVACIWAFLLAAAILALLKPT